MIMRASTLPDITADVVIIGGGLAGLSAAVQLVDAEKRVVILESEQQLGGRTASWKQGNIWVESGLHMVYGFYDVFLKLLKHVDINLSQALVWEDEFELRSPGLPVGRFTLSRNKTDRPTKSVLSGGGLLTYQQAEKIMNLMSLGINELVQNPTGLDYKSLRDFMDEAQISDPHTMAVLQALSEGVFHQPPAKLSAYAFFLILTQSSQRDHERGIGTFVQPLDDGLILPIVKYIEARQGEFACGVTVSSIKPNTTGGYRITHQLGSLDVKRVIIATSANVTQQILKQAFGRDSWLKPFFKLKLMTMVSVQLELATPVLGHDHVVFAPGTRIASFVEESRTAFSHSSGRLSVVMAEGYRYADLPVDELVEIISEDLEQIDIKLPAVTEAEKVIHDKNEYALLPGAEEQRPSQKTPFSGLYLAGDYTKQRGFTTMEGAVLSGQLAAAAVLEEMPEASG